MGRVIRLHGDSHRDLQDLLPWYVTGQLEPAEHARLKAHLETCAECQAEVRLERRIGVGIAQLPIDVEQGWMAMSRRLEQEPARPRSPIRPLLRPLAPAPWLGWATAAVLLLSTGLLLAPSREPAGVYHALGAAPATAAGNVVVMFKPETREKDLREILKASHARVVDGPTVTDAYVLRVPAAERQAALARLHRHPDVLLAEPLDDGAAR
ncbi:MAG: zf-HC2 protein [Caulobacteraceae bacterium]|nr:zf-HC2 protein [Caulobacteraceae bacterium]